MLSSVGIRRFALFAITLCIGGCRYELVEVPTFSAYAFVRPSGTGIFIAKIKEFSDENHFDYSSQPQLESPIYRLENGFVRIEILQFTTESPDQAPSGAVTYNIALYTKANDKSTKDVAKTVWLSFFGKLKNLSVLELWKEDTTK